jgi:hypothetical protein
VTLSISGLKKHEKGLYERDPKNQKRLIENQEMDFWRNRKWSIRDKILYTMAVEILLGTKKSFFSVSPNLHLSMLPFSTSQVSLPISWFSYMI